MDQIIQEDIQKIKKNLEPLKSKIKGKTFLVTGGAGFLGSWFCDVLDSFGARIICVDNVISGSKDNIEHLVGRKNFVFLNQNFLELDIDEKIDYIVHMASIATPPLYMKYPLETLESNIIGTRKLLDLAREKKVKGFLFMSTSEIYGSPRDEDIPTKETFHGLVSSFGPRSMYDEGKRAAEAYCYSYYQKFKIPIRVARTFNTFGPRLDVRSTSQYGRAIIKFIYQAVKNKPITVYGNGGQTRSFCYITDQIEGLFRLLLTPGADGEVFNIGNPRETNILDLAETIVKITDSTSKIDLDSPENYDLKDDPRRRCPDISKADKALGYKPKVSLEGGIKRTADWLKSRGE